MTHLAYEWDGVTNWGDQLSVPLLRRFAGIQALATSSPAAADIVCVGSTIGHLGYWFGGHIIGAGKMFPQNRVPSGARVWAVRGRLSLPSGSEVLGRIALGDPGLLADELIEPVDRVHKLGLLPHWSDTELAERTEFRRYDPLIINPRRAPEDVIRDIASCDKLVTSSLHGLIVADSLGIPRRFELAKKLAHEGSTFKHEDYSSGIGHPLQIGVTSSPNRFVINDTRDRLIDRFEEFGEYLRSHQ